MSFFSYLLKLTLDRVEDNLVDATADIGACERQAFTFTGLYFFYLHSNSLVMDHDLAQFR